MGMPPGRPRSKRWTMIPCSSRGVVERSAPLPVAVKTSTSWPARCRWWARSATCTSMPQPGQEAVRREGDLHALKGAMGRMDTDEAEDDRGLPRAPRRRALLTSGTMAKAAAAGHRVVLVLATDGGMGLAAAAYTHDPRGLGSLRLAEAQASADALGVAKIEWLGYADSGSGPVLEPNPSDRCVSPGLASRRPPSDSRPSCTDRAG